MNRSKGFTLAEIAVSLAIISLGGAALMGCLRYSFFVMQMARENQRATQIMLERAEAIRLCSWDQVNTTGFIPTTPTTDYYDPTAPNGSQGAVYNITCAINSFPWFTSYRANMRKLTITATWNTGSVTRSRTNVTYIARDGIQNYVY